MARRRAFFVGLGVLLAAVLLVGRGTAPTARAFAEAQATEQPTLTLWVCHACDEEVAATDTPTPYSACSACELAATRDVALMTAQSGGRETAVPGIVRPILFWMSGCPRCRYVLEDVLPPLQEQFGEQLEILLVEVVTVQDVDRLHEVAAGYGIPRERVGVPLLIIGEQVLIGPGQIPAELPALIAAYLAAGGVDYPGFSVLAGLIATPTTSAPGPPVVNLLIFWTSDCRACREVLSDALPPLNERYGEQLSVQYVDVVSREDVNRFYQVAAALGVSQDEAHLPMIVIGEHVLIGSEWILAELPGLVERTLAAGGVEAPDISGSVAGPPELEAASPPTEISGFTLAVAVMAGMVAALVAVGAQAWRTIQAEAFPPASAFSEKWRNLAFPALALVGLGVAGYLAYIETRMVQAVCGPVGDCNAVQSSPYARLFGVLPVGVLGMLGYLTIVGAWGWSRLRRDRLGRLAPLAVFGMALFGTLFSLYLTALELFVIKAVCIWCVISAVLMTLLLLLSLHPALRSLIGKPDADEEPA